MIQPDRSTSPTGQDSLADGCVAAVIPAAGSGRRFGDERNKLFATLGGKPLWVHAVSRLAARPEVGRIIMAVADGDRDVFEGEQSNLVNQYGVELVAGGAERTDSVEAGLAAVGDDPAIALVAIHDAARPLIAGEDLASVFVAANQTGAALLATPVAGTVKRDRSDAGCETVDRRDLWIALTPQVFRIDVLRAAYEKHRGRAATDDAQLVERMGHAVKLVPGSADNLKITLPEDLAIAEAMLERQTKS